MMQISKNKRSKWPIILISVLALLALLGALAYSQKWWPFSSPTNIIDGVNYGPPTQDEIENSQNAKKDIIEDETASEDTEGRRTVQVGVSHADIINDSVEIRAFINGVVEGTGTCTATLTKPNAQTVTESSKAFVDASTSQCEPILIPINQFNQDGEWQLVVTYNSPTSSGTSEEIIVTI